MTKQYKNPFENPDAEFYGKKVKDYKIPKRKEIPLEGRINVIKGSIYIPPIKLYVAKERSLFGRTWHDAHKELHKQGWQMLTIRQFIDFILYLKQNKSNIPEAKQILDEILIGKKPYGGEWLDARFSNKKSESFIKDVVDADDFMAVVEVEESEYEKLKKKAEKLYMHYNHKTVKGKLVAKNKELLKKCLMYQWCDINLKSCNKQGLPTKRGSDTEYRPPISGSVAAFWTANAVLHCEQNADSHPSIADLGVRAALNLNKK